MMPVALVDYLTAAALQRRVAASQFCYGFVLSEYFFDVAGLVCDRVEEGCVIDWATWKMVDDTSFLMCQKSQTS
jgi:hypothetical protein